MAKFYSVLRGPIFRSLVVSFFKGGYKEMNSVYIQVCLVTAFVVTSNGVYLVITCLSWKQHATVNYLEELQKQNAETKGGISWIKNYWRGYSREIKASRCGEAME